MTASLTRFAWLSIAAALVTIGLKSAAYFLTGSVGLLSDALESLVNLAAGIDIETWTAAGTNAVAFTAPNAAGRMPIASGGDFAAVYASTPPNPAASVFNIRVTDANGLFADIPLNVLVNAFKSGTLNDARSSSWREDFR